jgi:Uma2 family endonuclease
MAQPAPAKSTRYQQLADLPENLTGEIINGELHVQPRPAGPHAVVSSVLGMDIGNAFHRGRGGPGGWWILDEPEIHFVRDTEVLVPDLAGWRRTRMPEIPQDQRFEITPDWVCEILSPSTMQKDRVIKMPVYARYGVPHIWLVDPLAHTLEVFLLQDDRWSVRPVQGDRPRTNRPL